MSGAGSRGIALGLLSRMSRTPPVTALELRGTLIASILVVRQDDRIGNLLFITPLLRGFKTLFPDAILDVVTSSRFRDVLAHNPCVTRVIPVDRRRYRRAPQEIAVGLRALKLRRYDLIVDGKPGPSLSNTVVVMAARGGYRLGFDHEHTRGLYSLTVPRGGFEGKHEIERLYTLIDAVWGRPECPRMEFHFPEGRGPEPEKHGVTMHIGGHGRKRVPAPVLVDVIRAVRESGRSLEILAGPEERSLVRELSGELPGLEATFPDDIVALAERIGASEAFIGPDTGALHIAAALEVPAVNLFVADTSPTFGPWGTRHVVIDFHAADAVDRVMAFLGTTVRG
jgi:ADP-heptose:LPS heptosyltransferase